MPELVRQPAPVLPIAVVLFVCWAPLVADLLRPMRRKDYHC